jgi:hypothetical protein
LKKLLLRNDEPGNIKHFTKVNEPSIASHIAPLIYYKNNDLKKKLYQILNYNEEKTYRSKKVG